MRKGRPLGTSCLSSRQARPSAQRGQGDQHARWADAAHRLTVGSWKVPPGVAGASHSLSPSADEGKSTPPPLAPGPVARFVCCTSARGACLLQL